MKTEVELLIKEMEKAGIDLYIIPSCDPHASEYVSPYYRAREFVSGFTGSAGTLVVSAVEASGGTASKAPGDSAYLWTDGRYFLQAGSELKGSGIKLMKTGEPGVPSILEFIKSSCASGQRRVIGFDGTTMPYSMGQDLAEIENADIEFDLDLVDRIWKERPVPVSGKIWQLPLSSAGVSFEDKLSLVREAIKDEDADKLILSDLMETAWLLNLRGSDIQNTPVFYSYAIVGKDDLTLYVRNAGEAAEREELQKLIPGAVIKEYDDFFDDIKLLPGKSVWLDPGKISYKAAELLPKGSTFIKKPTPVELMKAVKNKDEIDATIRAHIMDAASVTRFIYWLKKSISKKRLTEIDAAKKIDGLRLSSLDCFDLSFPTIAGYNRNGAIIHYEPTEDTNSELAPEGFLLVDSGGQYKTGTTDITRTIALGPLTDKMEEYYTLVLKSHIALATAKFREGTTGKELDDIARRPLLEHGLDYAHGTGHGVGHVLSVHEGPNHISKSDAESPILPGMITSNEPGVYIEGEFGIRLENEILCERADPDDPGSDLCFRTISLAPFERDAIVPEMLTKKELGWLNDYNQQIRDSVTLLLGPDEAEWLMEVTKPYQI